MHLLLAQKGTITDADEAVDLGQTPADMVFITAADTEIAALAQAKRISVNEAKTYPSLRCANLTTLSHNMSIDIYARDIIAHAKLVIIRVLGGASYWQYGLESCLSICARNNTKLIVLPGDDKADQSLDVFNLCSAQEYAQIWSYFNEGGPHNMANLLQYAACLLGASQDVPPPAIAFLKAGLWSADLQTPSLADFKAKWINNKPVVAIIFYRALVLSGGTQVITELQDALIRHEVNVLPIFVSSLKDEFSKDVVRAVFSQLGDDELALTINLTGFAVSTPGAAQNTTILDETGAPVFQAVLASHSQDKWQENIQGLSARDLAMNIALPEVDGRIITHAIGFKSAHVFDDLVQANIISHQSNLERIEQLAKLVKNWARLRKKPASQKRVAIILANYPNRDGRLGNGVGLDTPASTIDVLKALSQEGYKLDEIPADGNKLIEALMAGPTNATASNRYVRETISLNQYKDFLATLTVEIQNQVHDQWGAPESDPFFLRERQSFALPLMKMGHVWCGIQPARGYNIDPKATYHSPDLVPPHGYLAFYAYLKNQLDVDAVIHMGKHGNLEWLPGKALALSSSCYPEVLLGNLPHFYPFIVNDPGEGTQAKRRTHAVIIDHLTPPLTRAEAYGPLRDLEALVDEYYQAAGHDPRRLSFLKTQIMEAVELAGLDDDASIRADDNDDDKLEKLDAYLCDLKEMQIRDGLHIFGSSLQGRLRRDLIVALARLPRNMGIKGDASLQRAIADDLKLGFDPLDCTFCDMWTGPKPDVLSSVTKDMWRSFGDTVERIELLAELMVEGKAQATGPNSSKVLENIQTQIAPLVDACGSSEMQSLLDGLAGNHVFSGSSGAPTRGRVDVLPTGRNFYSVDSRSVPTPAAWELGKKSAELVILRYVQDNGEWPVSFGLSAWGTANMRTGGDDIAQAMAFIGVKPVWDNASRRVTGYEIISLAELGRPRVDVVLRISGFFRDAFPTQISLFDQAVRAVAALNEPADQNLIAMRFSSEKQFKIEGGMDEEQADLEAGFRIFGSKPGAYGAGLQALIDEKIWNDRGDLAGAYLTWGGYAYGAKAAGDAAINIFEKRLSDVQAVLHNQDNREHDLLDSDDYYQFQGGMTAAVEHISGERPEIYHNDHSRPERPMIRRLEEEIGRVVRARAVNPKWIAGVMRHGYKGAFEMAATTDYLFAFSATTGAVKDHHFEALHDAYLRDEVVLQFLRENNPNALRDIASRLNEAIERGLWTPRRNAVNLELHDLMGEKDGQAN